MHTVWLWFTKTLGCQLRRWPPQAWLGLRASRCAGPGGPLCWDGPGRGYRPLVGAAASSSARGPGRAWVGRAR
eukprot:7566318-Lingulodinium_polyedra.AAC.1